MFKNNLSSETAFDMFLKSTGNTLTRVLKRVDFHKAINQTVLKLGAPELDALFVLLDANEDGELDLHEWK